MRVVILFTKIPISIPSPPPKPRRKIRPPTPKPTRRTQCLQHYIRTPILLRQTRITNLRRLRIPTVPKNLLHEPQPINQRHNRLRILRYARLIKRTPGPTPVIGPELSDPDRFLPAIVELRDIPDRVVDVRFVEMHRDDVDRGNAFWARGEEGRQPVGVVGVGERGRDERGACVRAIDQWGEVLGCGGRVCEWGGAAVGVVWFVEEFEVGGRAV